MKDSYELYIPSRKPYFSLKEFSDKLRTFPENTRINYKVDELRLMEFENSSKDRIFAISEAEEKDWNVVTILFLTIPMGIANFCRILDPLVAINPKALVAIKEPLTVSILKDVSIMVDLRHEYINFNFTTLNQSSGILNEDELVDFLTRYGVEPSNPDLEDILISWKGPLYISFRGNAVRWLTKQDMITNFPRLAGIHNFSDFFDRTKIHQTPIFQFKLPFEEMIKLFSPVTPPIFSSTNEL